MGPSPVCWSTSYLDVSISGGHRSDLGGEELAQVLIDLGHVGRRDAEQGEVAKDIVDDTQLAALMCSCSALRVADREDTCPRRWA